MGDDSLLSGTILKSETTNSSPRLSVGMARVCFVQKRGGKTLSKKINGIQKCTTVNGTWPALRNVTSASQMDFA